MCWEPPHYHTHTHILTDTHRHTLTHTHTLHDITPTPLPHFPVPPPPSFLPVSCPLSGETIPGTLVLLVLLGWRTLYWVRLLGGGFLTVYSQSPVCVGLIMMKPASLWSRLEHVTSSTRVRWSGGGSGVCVCVCLCLDGVDEHCFHSNGVTGVMSFLIQNVHLC